MLFQWNTNKTIILKQHLTKSGYLVIHGFQGWYPTGNDHICPFPVWHFDAIIFLFPFGGMYIYIYFVYIYICIFEVRLYSDYISTCHFVIPSQLTQHFPQQPGNVESGGEGVSWQFPEKNPLKNPLKRIGAGKKAEKWLLGTWKTTYILSVSFLGGNFGLFFRAAFKVEL